MNFPFARTAMATVITLAVGVATALPAQAQSISGSSSQDIALATQARQALVQAAPFQDADTDLEIAASNGNINVSGWVSYTNDDTLARAIVSKVEGVHSVTTNLRAWSTAHDPRV